MIKFPINNLKNFDKNKNLSRRLNFSILGLALVLMTQTNTVHGYLDFANVYQTELLTDELAPIQVIVPETAEYDSNDLGLGFSRVGAASRTGNRGELINSIGLDVENVSQQLLEINSKEELIDVFEIQTPEEILKIVEVILDSSQSIVDEAVYTNIPEITELLSTVDEIKNDVVNTIEEIVELPETSASSSNSISAMSDLFNHADNLTEAASPLGVIALDTSITNNNYNANSSAAAAVSVAELPDEVSEKIETLIGEVLELNRLTDEAELAPVLVMPVPIPLREALITAAQFEMNELCELYCNSLDQFGNGRAPMSALSQISYDTRHYLRPDAAIQFERLNELFKDTFGYDIPITDSWRSLQSQINIRASRPHLAAVPGTSLHGLGTALDLGGNIARRGTREWNWLNENGPYFGWFQFTSAWHFEFHPERTKWVDFTAEND